MKRQVLMAACMLITLGASAQHLVVGNHDVVRLGEYPQDAYLIEADEESFYRVSGAFSTSSDHPLLIDAVNPDHRSIYFIKYDKEAIPQKSNYIRGTNQLTYAASFNGGLTLMSSADMEVDASGTRIPVPPSSEVEFIASYDSDCQLQKIIPIWALTENQFMDSRAVMDPEDGSVYVFGKGNESVDLLDFGPLAAGLESPNSYMYVIKYGPDLVLEWVYQAGFDMAQSGTTPSFGRMDVFPGLGGEVLLTGTYGTESSPLINGRSLPAYMDTNGTFAVLLDGAGQERWVLDGAINGFGYPSRIIRAFPLPGGDFVLVGNSNTGYFKLGETDLSFSDASSNNQFVVRIDPAGNPVWIRPVESQGPLQEGKKKSAQSMVLDNTVYYDAITWRNRLLFLTAPYQNPAFNVAGEDKPLTFGTGIYIAAIDLRDGSEVWAYALSSDDARIHGFDVDRAGNVSLMGFNYATQDMEGLPTAAVVDGNFLFHVGLDYNGKPLWYNNASLTNPPYSDLSGVDLEVLPNGEIFSSLKLTALNEMVIGDGSLMEMTSDQTSWLVKLSSDVEVGGIVTDAGNNPVYPGYVRAIKSTWWGTFPQVDSTLLQDDGSFLFDKLYPGNYTLMAVPDPEVYPNAICTYVGDQTGWIDSPFYDLVPKFTSSDAHIQLTEVLPLSSNDGSGELSGTISLEDPQYTESRMLKGAMARPAKKSSVILLKKAKKSTLAGEVAAYAETDGNGVFTFSYVPDGDYLLHVEVPGLEMLEIHEISVEGNQIVSGLNYTISEEGIYIGFPTGISLLENEELLVYPNPGPGLIMMDLPGAGEYRVQIFAMDGKLVHEELIISSGGARAIHLNKASDGVYIIRVQGPGVDETIKYLKK